MIRIILLSRLLIKVTKKLKPGEYKETMLLLCGHPNRPHYGSCPSVCLSVCVCSVRLFIRKQKGTWKPKLVWMFPGVGVTGMPIFSCQRWGGWPHNMSATVLFAWCQHWIFGEDLNSFELCLVGIIGLYLMRESSK